MGEAKFKVLITWVLFGQQAVGYVEVSKIENQIVRILEILESLQKLWHVHLTS